MNNEILQPRKEEKENKPIVKKLEVSVSQRAKFIGLNGMNLKRIYSKTGATISPLDETNFNIFAPNKNSMEEAEEMIKTFLEQPVYIFV